MYAFIKHIFLVYNLAEFDKTDILVNISVFVNNSIYPFYSTKRMYWPIYPFYPMYNDEYLL